MYNALDKCLIRDRNLAIGFFNLAIYNFKCRNYVESRQNFMAGYECLRSNDQIDYRPLNLNIILHESDITYNLALCCLAMENIEDFKSFVNSALETAQDIERHGLIRMLEKDKDNFPSHLNYDLLELPTELFQVSKKNKKALAELGSDSKRMNSGLKKKVVGGDGKAGFVPDESRRTTATLEPPMSAKLTAMLAKEMKNKDPQSRNSTALNDLYGRFSAFQNGTPSSMPASPLPTRASAPTRPPPMRSTLTNPVKDIVEESKIHSDDPKMIRRDEPVSVPRMAELRLEGRDSVGRGSSGSLAASDGNKKNNSHAGMSHTSKISDAKNSESLSRDDDSLSQFSEGVGENKMQVNQRKDEKRLEVKVPSDCDGLNRSIRLAVKGNAFTHQ